MTDDKEERSQFQNYFQNHGIKYSFFFKNSSQYDCILVENVYEILETPKNLFLMNFDLQAKTLCYLLGKFPSLIHVFINQKSLKLKRKEKLYDLVNGFVFKNILDKFSSSKNKDLHQTFELDSYEKKISLYNYEKFLFYLHCHKYLKINEIREKKRINFFYVKSFTEIFAQIINNKDLEPLRELSERKNFLILDQEAYRNIESHLVNLKKQGVLNFTAFTHREFQLSCSKNNQQKMLSNFIGLIEGYNGQVFEELSQQDILYAEVKNLGFGFFSRSHKYDQDVKQKLIGKLEGFLSGNNGLMKFDNEDWRKILPFSYNFKKQDLLKDFSKIYEENVAFINKNTFNLTLMK